MLQIGEPHVIFESSSALSDIFYDDVNKKIIKVHVEEIVEVKTYGLRLNEYATYRLKGKGRIRIIKFSPDERLVCVQYDQCVVDFINLAILTDDPLSVHFSRSTKSRSARIIGLEWIQTNQILFITNQGLELYQVNVNKKSVKLLKSHNITLYWFLYYPHSQFLIVSNGLAGALLNPFAIQNGSIHVLAKFEIDFGRSDARMQVLEREVFIASIYNVLYVAVLRNINRSANSDVALYKISTTGMEVPQLEHILCLDMIGAFALHVINNLVVVHHQSSKASLIFDIDLQEPVKNGPTSHRPFLKTSLSCSNLLQSKFSYDFPLYSNSWVMFQPNFVADAHIGVFTTVSLNPNEGMDSVEDKYLRFLYNRNVDKSVFLENLKSCMVAEKLKLRQLGHIFDWIAQAMAKRSLSPFKHNVSNVKCVLMAEPYERMSIEQSDVVGNLFLLPDDYTLEQKKRFLHYMLRYLAALQENKLEVQPYFLIEILVPTMVTTGYLERLHQLLLFRVIPDAKQLAFQLLSHETKYPPLVQQALDMLSRLGTATEEIVEVLMARGLVTEAIRFLESCQSLDKINGLKLIENAWKEDRQIRYGVFSYFLEHGGKNRNISITNTEQFEEFSKKFRTLFKDEEIEAAKKESFLINTAANEINYC